MSSQSSSVRFVLAILPALVCGQSYQGPAYVPEQKHPLPIWLDQPKQVKVAQCAVDVGLSTIFLGTAGTSINAAVRNCRRQITDQQKAACSASISGVMLGFGYAAGFLSQAAADCQSSLQVVSETAVHRAQCAADIATLTAMLAVIANSGSSMREVCGNDATVNGALSVNARRLNEEVDHVKMEEDWLHKFGTAGLNLTSLLTGDLEKDDLDKEKRDLSSLGQTKANPFQSSALAMKQRMKDRSGELAECVFDVGQSTLFLARAAMKINSAVSDCSRFELRTGGPKNQAKCSVDVASIIASFSFVASGVSFACFHCPFYKSSQPACAGSIINMIAALAEVAAVGSSLQASCGDVGRRLTNVSESEMEPKLI